MPIRYTRCITFVAISLMLFLSSGAAPIMAQDGLTLNVTTSATQVEVGDTITVTGNLMSDGNPGGLGFERYTLTIETAPGVPQDTALPIFEPAQPEAQESNTFTLTAARPGSVTFGMSVNGETAGTTENGDLVFFFTSVGGRSGAVTVAGNLAEPVTIPEPLTITLFATGLLGMAGYARRKRE